MATADVMTMAVDEKEEAAYVWKTSWPDKELERPGQGNWWEPSTKFDAMGGGYFPETPLSAYASRYGASSGVPLGQHSAGGAGGGYATAEQLADSEWRRKNLTILGVAEQKHEEGVAIGTHAYGEVNPYDWILGPTPYVLAHGMDFARTSLLNLPTPLAGKEQPVLDDTVEHFFTAQANESWDEIVPLKTIDQNASNVVLWMVTEYKAAMASEKTPMGLPTVVEVSAHSGRHELRLHGISGRISLGFWKTEMGTRCWWEIVQSLAGGIHARLQFSAALTLAGMEDRYFSLQRLDEKGGFKPKFDWYFNSRSSTFALFQRPHHNWFNIFMKKMEEIGRLRHMDFSGPKPVLLVTPEEVNALNMGCKDGISYAVSGPDGPARLNAPTISKVTIYTTTAYVISAFPMPNDAMVQALANQFEVGERAEMMRKSDRMDEMTIRVLGTSDKWVEITLADAVDKLALYGPEGGIIYPEGDPRQCPDPPTWWPRAWNNRPYLYDYYPFWYDAAKKSDPHHGWMLVDDFPDTKDKAKGDGYQVAFDTMQIMLCQIRQSGYGHMAILMIPGRVCVNVRKTGHAVLEDSFAEMVHQVSAEYWAGCAEVAPKNQVQAPCVYCLKTGEGYGTDPIRPNHGGWPVRYNPNAPNGVSGDMIYMALPPRENFRLEQIPTNVNLRGIIDDDLCKIYARDQNVHANSYPGYRYYDWLYSWTALRCGSPGPRKLRAGYRVVDLPVNIALRQMCYQRYKDQWKDFNTYEKGRGWWGFDGTYEGAIDDRNAGCFLPNGGDRGQMHLA